MTELQLTEDFVRRFGRDGIDALLNGDGYQGGNHMLASEQARAVTALRMFMQRLEDHCSDVGVAI